MKGIFLQILNNLITIRLAVGGNGLGDCHFQLLGGMSVSFDGEEVVTVISAGKVRLLLSYLVLTFDMPQSRKKIAFDFWPDSTEKQALSNLRKLLHSLRESFPQIDRYLQITPTYIRWNRDLAFYSDVREFEQVAKGSTLFDLRKAEELYRGELLPGYYEEWLGAKREQLAQTYSNVLDKLISALKNQREYSSAIFFANKLLTQNKVREETYRTLMQLHALNKNTAEVVHIYRQLQTMLQDELGIDPAEETIRLLDRLTQNGSEPQTVGHSPTPLIGRVEEWERLLSVWKQATDGGKALLILKGEAGIGKTRLALEWKAWVESQGGWTAFAGCFPSMRSLSYSPVAAWLRSLPVPQLGPVVLSELSRLLPELSERYPGLPQSNPIQENWQLIRWYDAIERMLLARQPLLLILDDIQWSDRETLQLLSYLLRSDTKAKLFVIATMRTDENPDDAVGTFFSGLHLERSLKEIELAPLTEEETKRLMAVSVGDVLAERHSSGIYAKTGGNPLFIVETLRESQTLSDKSGFRLSPLVKTVIENRLSRLLPDNRKLASTIAAIGRPVSPLLLVRILNMKEEAILEWMDQLDLRKVVQEDENGQYDFTHDIVKEAAYNLTNESRRRQIHRQIARGLLAFHREQPEIAAAEIAFHYELGGQEKEAINYYELAATAAEKIYANETRIKYYKKLCILLPPDQNLSILMKLGDALILMGDWNEAEKTYRQWLERSGNAAALQERSFCDVALGNCLRLQGKYREASFHLERALRCFELLDDHSGLSSVYVELGLLHYYQGNYDEVLDCQMKRMELPLAENRTKEDCRFFGIIGHVFYDQCEYSQAIHWIKQQIGLAAETQDNYTIEQAMGVLAMVYMDIDEMERAFDLLVDKLEISKSIGDRMGFANALGMLGKHYWYCGHHAHSSPCIAFCLEEALLIKDWRVAAIMLGFEGRTLLAQQRLEEADLLLGHSIRLFQHLRTPYFACETLYFMSLLKQRQNRYENAVEVAEEALQIAERLKRRDMHVNLFVLLAHLKTDLGWMTTGEAMELLEKMLEQYPGQQERAAIHFAMWKLSPESPEHQTSALLLNEELYRKSGKEQYLIRCSDMNAPTQAAVARPLPQLAAEAVHNKRISPGILAEIDRYLKRSTS